jgi:hypothetical protein
VTPKTRNNTSQLDIANMSSSPKLKLYRRNGASSLIPHILLQYLGLPFTAIVLEVDANNKFAAADGSFTHAEYLKINPMGSVPALDVGGGVIVTELPAILTYIVGLASSSAEAVAGKNGEEKGEKDAAGMLGVTLLERAQVAQVCNSRSCFPHPFWSGTGADISQ